MEKILVKGDVKNTLFTGSSRIGEHLAKVLKGKIKLEDGGYDWKILGPDVPHK
jgi:1-pyrroline-5-carboxylate dehydrogenase